MASRGIGLPPNLRLPTPTPQYDEQNERETRRLLEQQANVPPDWTTVKTIPAPVTALATIPAGATDTVPYFTSPTAMAIAAFGSYARSLVAAISAVAARVVLNIVEHRSSQSFTTASLGAGASATGTVAMPDTVCRLLTITADRAAWIRIYADANSRTNDAGRVLGVAATPGTGVLAEFVWTTVGMTFPFTIVCGPVPVLANNDGTPANLVYYTVVNESGAPSTVTITLGYGALP